MRSLRKKKNGKGKNSIGIGSGELSADTPAIRSGGSESTGDLNVPSPGQTDNKRESGRTSNQSGGGFGGDFRRRRGKSGIKEIREQVKKNF